MEQLDKKMGLLIVILLSITLILIGGSFLYKHNQARPHERNPLYFAIGIAFAGGGGQIISSIALALLVPSHILTHINEIKFRGKLL